MGRRGWGFLGVSSIGGGGGWVGAPIRSLWAPRPGPPTAHQLPPPVPPPVSMPVYYHQRGWELDRLEEGDARGRYELLKFPGKMKIIMHFAFGWENH